MMLIDISIYSPFINMEQRQAYIQ